MGGDFAPEKIIHGAILASNELSNNEHIVLIGNKKSILQELLHHEADENQFEIVDADLRRVKRLLIHTSGVQAEGKSGTLARGDGAS